jgi:hypothetical protein
VIDTKLPPLYSYPSKVPTAPFAPLADLPSYKIPSALPPRPPMSPVYSFPSNTLPSNNSIDFNPNDIFSTIISPSLSENISLEGIKDNKNGNSIDKVVGAMYLSKEVAWALTKINRQYRMKKISLNNINQQQKLMKQDYKDFDLQYVEYKNKYFNRLYTERLWMRPIYLDFNKYTFDTFPKIWTVTPEKKIDKVYEEYKEKPVTFQKFLNLLIRDDPIDNVILLSQHLQKLDEKLIQQYYNVVNKVVLEDNDWNTIKFNFKTLNLEMINEFWYYFNQNEKEFTDYIRRLLVYPGNYSTLVEYKNYMRNYQVFFTKEYNKIDKETDKKITELVEVITKLLNDWYDEIPERVSDIPTVYVIA